jgi:Zn-dependent protease with chaperone function
MNSPDPRRLQVTLTGTRLGACGDEELHARLKATFRVSDAQAAAMLKGRCVVKRGLEAPSARKLVEMLREVGLQAVVEEMAPPPTPGRGTIPASAATSAATPGTTTIPRAAAAPRPVATSTRPAARPPGRPSVPPAAAGRGQVPPDPVQKTPGGPTPSASRPAAVPPASRAPETSTPLEALLALENQRFPKPRVGAGYVASLLLVTLLCVAVPLLYVGLTVGIAYGWFWYLTHIHEHLPRNAQLVALMYALPGLTGAVLVLFLLRPLFSMRRGPRESLVLDPEKEPGFVAGVHALCRAIGVSPPSEIRLSWDANASVQFRRRWLSLFNGQKVLTIGLSMAGGLSARQFVGVLAHEFGHFAQRFGMICSFIVNSINAWLEHCAYGEDALTQKLSEWSDSASEKEHWFSWLVNLSLAAMWLAIRATRFLMEQLFHLSLRFSRYMSRQMEFDADRYEALLAGSHIYRTTARSLRALNHAFVEVNGANIEAWQEHRLLRNLPDAVAAHARDFDPARLAGIEAEMREQTATRYWDSHPPDVDRIDNAEKLRAPGIYVEDAPAAVLFRDFAGWCERATRLFYAEEGVRFSEDQLRSRDDILGHVRNRNEQREQLNRFFNGQFQPWPLLPLLPGTAEAGEAPGWQDCIDRIRAKSPEIARHWLQAHHAQQRRELLRTAVALGASSNQLGIGGADRSPEQMGAELEDIAANRMPFHRPLQDGFSLYGARIEHAIDSMSPPARDRAAQLRDTVAGMATLGQAAGLLEELAGAMRHFAGIAEESGRMPAGFAPLEEQFGSGALQLLVQAESIPQPVTSDRTVGGYLRACCRDLAGPGATQAPDALARAAWPMPAAFQHLYLLALGELVTLCEAAEKARGIRPIRLVA